MKNLSIYDRKFLAACRISAVAEPFTDAEFLLACGVDTTLTPEEFRDANKHRGMANCRGCGVRTFEQHTVECPHRALDGSRADFEAMRRNVARKYAKHFAEDWMRLQFAGHPPVVGEVDGEILSMLPDFVRKVYDPDYETEEAEDGQ